mgnify:CR=1 FL=1
MTSTSPVINLDQLVKEHAGTLQVLEWQRMLRANLASELLTQQRANQILRAVLGVMLRNLGGTYTITIDAMQAFDSTKLEPYMVTDPQTQNWLLSLVEKKV